MSELDKNLLSLRDRLRSMKDNGRPRKWEDMADYMKSIIEIVMESEMLAVRCAMEERDDMEAALTMVAQSARKYLGNMVEIVESGMTAMLELDGKKEDKNGKDNIH